MKKRPDASALDAIFQKGKDEPEQAQAPTPAPADEKIQVSAYIPKPLYRDMRRKLADEDRNFTGLLIELLSEWVQK